MDLKKVISNGQGRSTFESGVLSKFVGFFKMSKENNGSESAAENVCEI